MMAIIEQRQVTEGHEYTETAQEWKWSHFAPCPQVMMQRENQGSAHMEQLIFSKLQLWIYCNHNNNNHNNNKDKDKASEPQ